MFGIKHFIKENILYPHSLFPRDSYLFPNEPVANIRMRARLLGLMTQMKEQKKYAGFEHMITYPHVAASHVWKMLLPYNPNDRKKWLQEKNKYESKK